MLRTRTIVTMAFTALIWFSASCGGHPQVSKCSSDADCLPNGADSFCDIAEKLCAGVVCAKDSDCSSEAHCVIPPGGGAFDGFCTR
jgi:hypothetical protein